MNDYRDQFEAQLLQASKRRYPAKPSSRWRRKAVVLPSVGLLAVGSAVAATQPWNPTLGNPDHPNAAPERAADSPPASELAMLGVLRREQTEQDRGRGTQDALRVMSAQGTTGVRTAYVRRVATAADGGSVVLVPSQSWGIVGRPKIPDALCVIVVGVTDGYAGKACFAAANVRNGEAIMSVGGTLYGLVPDGVTTVKARFGEHATTAAVRDNAFVLTTETDEPRAPVRPDGMVGLDAAGRVVLDMQP